MTTTDGPERHRDWQAFPNGLAAVEVAYAGGTSALVSSWSGRCHLIDWDALTVCEQPLLERVVLHGVPLSGFLASPRVRQTGGRTLFAAATKTAAACVWCPSDEVALRVNTVGSPVTHVGITPDLSRLAVGSGFYPLSESSHPGAIVELWDLEWSGERLVQATLAAEARHLLGAGLNAMEWSDNGDWLVLHTGARSQDRGYVILLNGTNLAWEDAIEVGRPFCSAIGFQTPPWEVYVLDADQVRRCVLAGAEERGENVLADGLGTPSCWGRSGCDQVVGNGVLTDLRSRTTTRRFAPLPGCAAVCATDHGVFGIAESGVVRIWTLDEHV